MARAEIYPELRAAHSHGTKASGGLRVPIVDAVIQNRTEMEAVL